MPRRGSGLPSQVLTGIGSLTGIVGLALLIRGRIPGGDRAALLDAAILATGIGALIWAIGFGPFVSSAGRSSLALAAFFYPALVALAAVARMWVLPGPHRPATRLIVLFVLASNAVIFVDILKGLVGRGDFAAPYLLSAFTVLAFVGAAALHPSMAISPERQHVDRGPIGAAVSSRSRRHCWSIRRPWRSRSWSVARSIRRRTSSAAS